MKAKYWNNTVEDGDRKRRRQAEFLIHKSVPLNLIENLAVYDYGKAEQVEDSLTVFNQKVQVRIDQTWYC